MKYKVMFKDFHIGDLTVTEKHEVYCVNEEIVDKLVREYPIFDILKKDIVAKSIPFFKVRLEHMGERFETDDYQLIPI